MRFINHIFILFLFVGCSQDEATRNSLSEVELNNIVVADSLVLNQNTGVVFYQEKPFTGVSMVYYPNGGKFISIQYLDGKKHGFYQKWFESGLLSYQSNYFENRQNGLSKTWWKNGKLRSESNFKNGVPDGEQRQWYESGELFKKLNLVNGMEVGLQQSWRKNGKIYNNYEAKNGRIFGLKRSTLCYELDDEEVQYSTK